MSKIIWGGLGVVAVCAAAATGAKIYADKSLAAYYHQQPIKQSSYSLKYSNYEMGAVKGAADIAVTWQRDPCVASSKMNFSGHDEIQRTWKGYEVNTTLTLLDKTGPYVQYFQQPIHAKTIISWAGTTKTVVDLPKINFKEAQQAFQLEPIQLKFDTQVKNHTALIKSLEVVIPQLMISDEDGQIQFKNVGFKTNQGLNQQALEEGFTELSVDNINVSMVGIESNNASFNKLMLRTDTEIKDQTVDFKTILKADQANVRSGAAYQALVMNLNLKDFNRSYMQNLFNLIQQQDSSCAAAQTYEKDLQASMLKLFNAGFKFESLKNNMTTRSGKVTADVTGQIMPNYVTSPESLVQMFNSLIDAKMDVQFDKKFLIDLLSMNKQNASNPGLPAQQVDAMLSNFEQQGRLKQDGAMVKMSMEYKFGQMNFLTPQ